MNGSSPTAPDGRCGGRSSNDRPGAATWWRRGAALVLVTASAAAILLGANPTVCRDQAADARVLEVCQPTSITDPLAVLILLVLAALLLPDLAEIEIGGVLRLRRTVEETRQDASALRSELAVLRSEAQSTSQASARQTIVVQNGSEVRQRETGQVMQGDVTNASDLLEPPEERGAYAQAAFNAGFSGLADGLFATAPGPVLVVGCTLDVGNLRATHTAPAADATGLIDDVASALGELPRTTTDPVLLQTAEGLAVVAHAYGDPTEPSPTMWVGAVVAIFDTADVGALDAIAEDQQQDLASRVEAAAGAYARLLIDLLGEPPSPRTSSSPAGTTPTGTA